MLLNQLELNVIYAVKSSTETLNMLIKMGVDAQTVLKNQDEVRP